MILSTWSPSSLESALRRGEAVDLQTQALGGHLPEQVVPLCRTVAEPAWRRWLPPPARPRPPAPEGPRVTVLIPSATRAPAGLDALLAQDEPVRVVLLWNGDGPAPVAGGGLVEVRRVRWQGHGRTRQEGVARVDTELVMLLVDDAVPLGAGFVRTMAEALQPGVDAVWARQVPWPTASARTRARLSRWCPATGPVPATRLDHVCALYRTATLLEDPLDDAPIAEDWLWGRRHGCALVPDAPVLHSHATSLRRSFARTRDIHEVLVRNGEPVAVDRARTLLCGVPGALGDRDALGELFGQWAAGRRSRVRRTDDADPHGAS